MRDLTFGERVKILIKDRPDLKPREIAACIGISLRALQEHSRGFWPSEPTREKYIRFFNCDRKWFMVGDGEPFPQFRTQPQQNQLRDADGLYGNTQIETGASPVGVIQFSPSGDQEPAQKISINNKQDRFWQAVSGLQDIYNSQDPVLIRAIESNIVAFRDSAGRVETIKGKNEEIKLLHKKYDDMESNYKEVKKRLDELDQRFPPGNQGPKDALNSS
jgi:hypothetical protein